MHKPLLAIVLACAAFTATARETPIHLAIAPGKAGEVCMPLAAGDTLAWRFKASAALDFNLHQHVGDAVLTPVERKGVAADRSTHTVERANEWCLMWTAPPARTASVQGAWWIEKAASAPASSPPPKR
jgi:hypothetical protein